MLQRYGAWTYLSGTFLFCLSWSFLDTWQGIATFIAGTVLILVDPVLAFSSKIRPQKPLLVAYAAMLASLVLFLLRDLIPDQTGIQVSETAGKIRLTLTILFLLSASFAFLYRLAIGLESTGQSSNLKDARSRVVRQSVLTILAAICIYTVFNYIAAKRNPVLDLSPGYYSFSENSRSIIKGLEQKVTIHAFLPVQQAVRNQNQSATLPELFRIAEDIRVMLEQLPLINSKIEIKFHNADLPEMMISEFGTVRNGTIIFRSPRTNLSGVDEKPYTERRVYVYNEKDILKLERESVRALIQVCSNPMNVYFANVNGERFGSTSGRDDPGGIETWKEMLRFYNFRVHKLDTAKGWPGEIPTDTDALVLAGPTTQYNDEAKKAVEQYLAKGGNVMALIAPESTETFDWLFQMTGAQHRFQKGFLSHIPRAPGLVITDNIQQHRITENLTIAGQANIALPGLGFFKREPAFSSEAATLKGFKHTTFLKSPFNTVNDQNRNGRVDQGEEKSAFVLGIAVENDQTGAKIAAFSTIDWLTEVGLRIRVEQRNPILASDTLFWMTESPMAAALVPLEKQTRNIRVTDSMKLKNMILGILIFPLLVGAGMGLSIFLYRRKTRFKAP